MKKTSRRCLVTQVDVLGYPERQLGYIERPLLRDMQSGALSALLLSSSTPLLVIL